MRGAWVVITIAGCGGGKAPDAVRSAPPPPPAYASAEPITSVRMGDIYQIEVAALGI